MVTSIAALVAIFAGVLNGFYVYPIRQGADRQNALIWVYFSLIAFIGVPLISLSIVLYFQPLPFSIHQLLIMVLVGVVYGVGVSLVADSMTKIGIGIPFVISLALVTVTGSIFASVVHHKLSSDLNWGIGVSYFLFLISIVFYAVATSARDKNTSKQWGAGLMLCLLGSVLQSSQGACLSYFSNVVKLEHGDVFAQFIPWFFIFIPCGVIFASLKIKELAALPVTKAPMSKIILFALGMSVINISSVIIYTYVNSHSKLFSERYLWAVFLGGIVLGSTILSFVKGEWNKASKKALIINFSGMFILFLSFIVMVLAVSQ
jgi:hypothetical protein